MPNEPVAPKKTSLIFSQCGDILLICGRSVISTLIAKYSAEESGVDSPPFADYSHAGFVISGAPIPLIIEAVVPRVHVVPVSVALAHADHATIMRPRFIAGREVELVTAACLTIGQWYGLTKYPGFMMDAVFHSDRFSRISLFDEQVCSQHVGQIFHTITYDFGENFTGLTPNEIGLWGQRHPEEWELIHLDL